MEGTCLGVCIYEGALFATTRWTFSRIDCTVAHKTSINKFLKIEINWEFSDHSATKLEINDQKFYAAVQRADGTSCRFPLILRSVLFISCLESTVICIWGPLWKGVHHYGLGLPTTRSYVLPNDPPPGAVSTERFECSPLYPTWSPSSG